MKRGTALKWADLLEQETRIYEPCQLRFQSPDGEHISPYGVLLEFLDKDSWEVAWDGVSFSWKGQQFFPPFNEMKSRCKSKLDQSEDVYGPELNWQDTLGASWQWAAEYVRNNYEVL
jgi:hypothetical protein